MGEHGNRGKRRRLAHDFGGESQGHCADSAKCAEEILLKKCNHDGLRCVLGDSMLSDLRFTFRSLRKSPGFTAIAVFTLALGLGVNTTMFSIVNAVLFRGLPYEDQDSLVSVNFTNPERGWDRMSLSMQEFNDLREVQTSFSGISAMQSGTMNVSGNDLSPERFTGAWMSGPGLEIIGAKPKIGRWWDESEDQANAAPVVVISQKLWQTRFGADPLVVGQIMRVNGEVSTIIGVTDGEFDYPDECDLWLPRRYSRTDEDRDTRYLQVDARLKPGVSLATAQREFEVIFSRWQQTYPQDYEGLEIRVALMWDNFVGKDVKQMLAIMTGAVSMVLLIACTNVANLLLVRGGARAKEMAIRAALGASRARTLRLLMLESFVLAIGGAMLGLPLAQVLLDAFAYAMATSGDGPPPWLKWEMDWLVMVYVFGAALLSCGIAGLMPAVRMMRPNLTSFLNDASRGSTGSSSGKLTRILVVMEVAFSCVLLVMSGLMIRSVVEAANIPLGYEPKGIMTARIGLPEALYQEDAQMIRFYQDLQQNLARRPEVVAVGFSSRLPTWNGSDAVVLENSALAGGARQPEAGLGEVSPGWMNVMGVELLEGRDFDDRDTREQALVGIVNAKAAEKFWPGQAAVGQRFKFGDTDEVVDAPWVTVVGVIPSIYQGDFEEEVGPEIYRPLAQEASRFNSVFIRTMDDNVAATAELLREEVRKIDPDLPIYWAQPLQDHLDVALFFKKLFAWIFGVFGGVALVMAGVGIYGVMAYSVSQRTQEIGVRMALGATPGNVVGMVLRQGGLQLLMGMTLGLVMAFFAAQLLQSFLYGVEPSDPSTFGGTFLVLMLAGILACLVPAWRALRVSPMEALRYE
jgi:predicted permease